LSWVNPSSSRSSGAPSSCARNARRKVATAVRLSPPSTAGPLTTLAPPAGHVSKWPSSVYTLATVVFPVPENRASPECC
jgi:hypothetical protein